MLKTPKMLIFKHSHPSSSPNFIYVVLFRLNSSFVGWKLFFVCWNFLQALNLDFFVQRWKLSQKIIWNLDICIKLNDSSVVFMYNTRSCLNNDDEFHLDVFHLACSLPQIQDKTSEIFNIDILLCVMYGCLVLYHPNLCCSIALQLGYK